MIDWSFEEVACRALDVPIEDLRKKGRTSDTAAAARYICYMHLYKTSNLSLALIGDRYYRDHSTVSHGLTTYQRFIDGNDKMFIRAVDYFQTNFKAPDEINVNKELSNEQIRTIKFMFKEGISIVRISSFYGVSQKTITDLDTAIQRTSKLHRSTKRAILIRYSKNQKAKQISEEMGIEYSKVKNVISNHKMREKNEKAKKSSS